jgi:hypothetical protein
MIDLAKTIITIKNICSTAFPRRANIPAITAGLRKNTRGKVKDRSSKFKEKSLLFCYSLARVCLRMSILVNFKGASDTLEMMDIMEIQ